MWEYSSVGRASALQAGGRRFESYCSHQLWNDFICGSGSVGRALPCQGKCREFESRLPLHVKQPKGCFLFERHLQMGPTKKEWNDFFGERSKAKALNFYLQGKSKKRQHLRSRREFESQSYRSKLNSRKAVFCSSDIYKWGPRKKSKAIFK